MPSVVVQIEPEPPAALAQAAIDGCDGALGAGRCLLENQAPKLGDFYAIVRLEGDTLEVVRVELHERSADGALLEARELHFAEPDTPGERSTSVGVVIAALVAAHQRRAVPRAQPLSPPPARQRPPTKPARDKHVRKGLVRIDLGATGASAFERSALALGASARGSLLFERIFLITSLGYERRMEDMPEVAWLTGGVGMGVRVGSPTAALGAELRSELVGAWLRISAERSDPPRQESETRVRFGPRLGLDAIWSFAPELGAVAGVQGAVLRPAVIVDIGGQTVERAPAFSWGGFFGLRWAPQPD